MPGNRSEGLSISSSSPTAASSQPASGTNSTIRTLANDLLAGLTVAWVAIPQCVGFATLAGLSPSSGLISAIAMGLVSAALSSSPSLVIGPVITASTMLLAIFRTVAPEDTQSWPALAGTVAILVGLMTLAGAVVGIGRLVRFVSRSVVVGLVVCSVLLLIGSQLPAALGVPAGAQPTLLGMLWSALHQLGQVQLSSLLMAAGVAALALAGKRLGPRFPTAFASLALSGIAAWLLESAATQATLPSAGALEWTWSARVAISLPSANFTELLAGSAAIALVGIIQGLAIGQALALRNGSTLDARRELWTLGLANAAAGLVGGFPGSASFARSALAELAHARTRFAGVAAAAATGLVALLAAPLMHYITTPAIAGLLIATALTMIDGPELRSLLRDVHDRPVFLTMVVCVLVLPIHWAILIGLAVSFIVLLRRVSRVHLFEMVRSPDGPFREQEMDAHTGRSAITMVQVEGPLFFAHADLLANGLRTLFRRGPRVTILRMRRTQQIDFSILTALRGPVGEYLRGGGYLIVCGLTREMRATLLNSPLGELVGGDFLLETTREVFGSAHVAIGLAQEILSLRPLPERPVFRIESSGASPADPASR